MESDYELEFLKQRHAAIKKQYHPDCQKSPYINEIVLYMKKTEIDRFDKQNRSPQISWRSCLVDLIFKAALELKIGHNAIHLAIKLLDGFMSGHDIEARRLELVSIGCLRIASKFEETDSKVPRLKSICALYPDINIRPEEYRCLEEMVLKYFKWNVNIPTISHFLEIFLPYSCGIEKEDINVFQNNYGGYFSNSSEILKRKLLDVVRAFRDVTLKERSLMSKLPSRVASAIIYCSRQICQLRPAWSNELKHTTGLLKYQFEDCIAILNQIYDIALSNPNKKRVTDVYEEQSPNIRKSKRVPARNKEQNRRYGSKTRLNKVLSDGSTVPIIDLDEDSSDINDDSSEVAIIEISPDNGYSSMESCGSSDANKSETSLTDDNLMGKDVNSRKENKPKDSCNSPRPRKKCKTDIETHAAISPDYPWYLRTNIFKKNSCATKSVQSFQKENFRIKEYSNCRRHLTFDKDENTEAFKKEYNPTKDINSTRSQTSLPDHLQSDMDNEVLILMEKICNKSEYSQNGGQKFSATGSNMF